MIRRFVLTTLSGLLLAGTAAAAPVLKSEAVVADPIVTVGDMFDDAGALAETPLFRAPKPGTTGMVNLDDVRAATARIGLVDYGTNGLSGIRVTRAAAIVDQAVLTGLITDDLEARGIITQGMSANTMFATPVNTINAEAVAQPATLVSLRYLPANGAFSARFTIAGVDHPLDVSGTIEMMIEAPHLVGSLTAGSVLGVQDIEMRPVPLRYAEASGVARIEDLLGKALNRQSREGMMLKATDVSVPLLIGKNDLVTIYYRKGPLTLTVKGQAVTGASQGSPLQVLNLMSKRVVGATALAAGAVEVSADALIAGL